MLDSPAVSYNGSLIFDYGKYFGNYREIYDNCYPTIQFKPLTLDYSDLVSFEVTDNLGNVICSYDLTSFANSTSPDIAIAVDSSLQLGDLNYNGNLDSGDESIMISYLSSNGILSNVQFVIGDINQDGIINMKDKSLLRLLIAGVDISSMSEDFLEQVYEELFQDDDIEW